MTIPFLLKKKQPTVTDMFEKVRKDGGFKKGELCILFAKPDCGKSAFTEQTLREINFKNDHKIS